MNTQERTSTDKLTNKPHITILFKADCSKLSASAKGGLTYHLGVNQDSSAYVIRVTANASGGFFSNEWITLDAILETIEANGGDRAFNAQIFKELYASKGANNHGFLAAVLRAEGVLVADEFKPQSNRLGDAEAFRDKLQALLDDGVELDDEVAAAELARAERKAEQMAKLQARQKISEVATLEDSGQSPVATSARSIFDVSPSADHPTTPASSALAPKTSPAAKKAPARKPKRTSK